MTRSLVKVHKAVVKPPKIKSEFVGLEDRLLGKLEKLK